MKKIMITFATALVLTACGTSSAPATTTDSTKTTVDSTKITVDSTAKTIGGGSGAGAKVEQPQK